MKKPYLGHPYGVLPKWMQFVIFIHSGLFNGGGGVWHFAKLHRIKCWYGRHKYLFPDGYNYCSDGSRIKVQDFVRDTCSRCGFTNRH